MIASTTPAATEPADDACHATDPPQDPIKQRPGASAEDWLTAAVVFGILGGCIALWLADLSLVTGMVAAIFSGLIGVLFADI